MLKMQLAQGNNGLTKTKYITFGIEAETMREAKPRLEHVQTNLTAGNILFYAKNFLEMDTENIQFIDMPQMMGGLVNNQSFVFINIDKWINVINEYLNPYKEDITQRNVSIKTSADQGESFYYSAGA